MEYSLRSLDSDYAEWVELSVFSTEIHVNLLVVALFPVASRVSGFDGWWWPFLRCVV